MPTKKREYVPANIRAGYTVAEAAKIVANSQYKAPFSVTIASYDHGRDVNGNGTAHYSCLLNDSEGLSLLRIVKSGKRREQVGYRGANEAALYALEKLGYEVDTSKLTSYDHQGTAVYPLVNFPPVEA